MYEITKAVIESGRFELAAMLAKIDTLWVQESLTDAQRTELMALAREKAVPENSYAGIQKQLDNLYANMAELAAAVKANTDAITVLQGGTTETPEPEEWPGYVQPTGAHDAYNSGDKMTYTDGRRYICRMDGCVWGPDTYPAAWEEATQEAEG